MIYHVSLKLKSGRSLITLVTLSKTNANEEVERLVKLGWTVAVIIEKLW